jgi:pilus assembly protein CpaF
VLTAGVDLPLRAIREQISSAFDLLIQISRQVDGSRRITHITEVLRMESDVITLQDIFSAHAPDEEHNPGNGRLHGLSPLQCNGLKPQFLDKLSINGVVLPPSFFEGDGEGVEAPRSTFAATSFDGAFQ